MVAAADLLRSGLSWPVSPLEPQSHDGCNVLLQSMVSRRLHNLLRIITPIRLRLEIARVLSF
jgi:hypothetical protein